MESIRLIEKRLINQVQTTHYRYLYPEINLDNRLTGLIGARGVGKTTLMLQFLKNNSQIRKKSIYFSADHMYFNSTTIYAFIEELHLTAGTEYFFIDEIHKYDNWNQELKNIFDGFPDIKIFFSGSSSLDLIKGSYDLSRRLVIKQLAGMSFREFLNFSLGTQLEPLSYKQIISGEHDLDTQLENIKKLKGLFQDYLHSGYYPFYFESQSYYAEKLMQVIEKTIYEDIANFYNLNTDKLPLFSKILTFLANTPPGKTTIHNLAKNLQANDRTISSYLEMLSETKLIQTVSASGSGNNSLRKPQKIFLNNTNLQSAISHSLDIPLEIGRARELFFISMLTNIKQKVYYSKVGDYEAGDFIFEIGGPNKTTKQIKNINNSYLIKDIQTQLKSREIPLMYFGFLY